MEKHTNNSETCTDSSKSKGKKRKLCSSICELFLPKDASIQSAEIEAIKKVIS